MSANLSGKTYVLPAIGLFAVYAFAAVLSIAWRFDASCEGSRSNEGVG